MRSSHQQWSSFWPTSICLLSMMKIKAIASQVSKGHKRHLPKGIQHTSSVRNNLKITKEEDKSNQQKVSINILCLGIKNHGYKICLVIQILMRRLLELKNFKIRKRIWIMKISLIIVIAKNSKKRN